MSSGSNYVSQAQFVRQSFNITSNILCNRLRSAIKNVSIDLYKIFLVRRSNKIEGLDLVSSSKG